MNKELRRRLEGVSANFNPHLPGTPPLGLTTADSDFDALYQAADLSSFAQRVWSLYAGQDAFTCGSGRQIAVQ